LKARCPGIVATFPCQRFFEAMTRNMNLTENMLELHRMVALSCPISYSKKLIELLARSAPLPGRHVWMDCPSGQQTDEFWTKTTACHF
jgi:hypothetical protein